MPLFGRLGRTLFACFGKGGTVDRQRNVTKDVPSSDRLLDQESTDDHEETAILETATAEAEHNVAIREENVPHEFSSHPAAEEPLSQDHLAPIEKEALEFKSGDAVERHSQQDSECSNVNRDEPEDVETLISEAVPKETPISETVPKQSAAFGAVQPQKELSKGPTDGHPASVQSLPEDLSTAGEDILRTKPESSEEVPSLDHHGSETSKSTSSLEEAENLEGAITEAVVEPEQSTKEGQLEDETIRCQSMTYSTAAQDVSTEGEQQAELEPKQSAAFGAVQPQEELSKGPTDGHPASVQSLPENLSAAGENILRTKPESSEEVPSLGHHGSETSKSTSSLEEAENLEGAIPEAVVEPEQSTKEEQLEDETITCQSVTYSTAAQDVSTEGEQQTELEPSANAQPQEMSEHKETSVFNHATATPEAVLVIEQHAVDGMHQLQKETILHKNPDQPAEVQQFPEDFPKSPEDEQPSESTEEIPQQDLQSDHQEERFEVAATPKTAAEITQSGVISTAQELSEEFFARVQREAIALQSVEPSDSAITGYVHVRNDAYEKLVIVRYTVDGWDSCKEAKAEWITSTDAQKSDKFRFVIPSLVPPYTVRFSVHYEVLGQEFWDNNNHKNYEVVYGYDVSD